MNAHSASTEPVLGARFALTGASSTGAGFSSVLGSSFAAGAALSSFFAADASALGIISGIPPAGDSADPGSFGGLTASAGAAGGSEAGAGLSSAWAAKAIEIKSRAARAVRVLMGLSLVLLVRMGGL